MDTYRNNCQQIIYEKATETKSGFFRLKSLTRTSAEKAYYIFNYTLINKHSITFNYVKGN